MRMSEILEELKHIHREGKVHRKLKLRLAWLAFIAATVLGILVYDIVIKGLTIVPVLVFSFVGYVIGYYLFSHMQSITWDEEREVVRLGKFDLFSLFLLVAYIAYRLLVEQYLQLRYTNGLLITGYGLATLFGGIVGRVMGMLHAVAKVHRENA